MSLDPAPLQPTGRDLIEGIVTGLASFPPGQLWPGFDPASMPLAVGVSADASTWLVNHGEAAGDGAPEPAAADPPDSATSRRAQLDEPLIANSVAMIAGRLTATIVVEPASTPAERAALAAHELFHVFQQIHYPHWSANEAALLTYPWDDPVNLARATHEADLLSQARDAPGSQACRELVSRALVLRRERIRLLPAEAGTYEQAIELTEGTARYVEHRAAGLFGIQLPDPDTRSGLDVRRRCYQTGRDWCILLDRLAGSSWPTLLPAGSDQPPPVLSDILTLAVRPSDDLTDDNWRAGLVRATATIDAETSRRAGRIETVRASTGGSVVIRSTPGSPLQALGFDPMNLTPIRDGLVLHERYLSLTSGETRITIVGQVSLTTAAGDHPLFSKLERAEILIASSALVDGPTWAPESLTGLGIQIDGPFTVRRSGSDVIEILPGDASPSERG